MAPANLPRLGEVTAECAGGRSSRSALALAHRLVVGLLPALSAARSQAQESLREAQRTTASPARQRVRSALVVAEVAMAMTLTIGAGLLLRSFVSVLGVDTGFEPDRLLTLQMGVPSRITDGAGAARVLRRSRSAAARGARCDERRRHDALAARQHERHDLHRGRRPQHAAGRAAGGGVPPRACSTTSARWASRCSRAGVQRRTMRSARRRSPSSTPRSSRACFPAKRRSARTSDSADRPGRGSTIVGVVGSIKHRSLEEAPKPELYITYRQNPPVGAVCRDQDRGDPGCAWTGGRARRSVTPAPTRRSTSGRWIRFAAARSASADSCCCSSGCSAA